MALTPRPTSSWTERRRHPGRSSGPPAEPAPALPVIERRAAPPRTRRASEIAEPSRSSNRSSRSTAEPASYRSRLGKARGLLSGYIGAVRSKGKDRRRHLGRPGGGAHPGRCRSGGDRRAPRRSEDPGEGREIDGPDALVDALKADLVAMLSAATPRWPCPAMPSDGAAAPRPSDGPTAPAKTAVDVWLFVGVNGVGKTTTVGKVANRMSTAGHQGPAGRG